MGKSLWSDEAHARHKHRRDYAAEAAADERAMRKGPYLDGHTLIIPGASKYFNREAAQFWRSKGFEWQGPDGMRWERDTQLELDGLAYTAQGWLTSTRQRFYEFYPTLRGEQEANQTKKG